MGEKESEYSDHKEFITVKSEDGTEHTYYSILCEDLPEEMLRKAREEVNETEENKREGMKKLREYMKKEKMLDIHDDYVIAVLRCSKYDIKKAKVKLEKFIKIYQMIMSKMAKFHLDMLSAVLSEMGVGIFPYRDREGRIIGLARPFSQMFSYDMELLEAGFIAAEIFVLTFPHASLLGTCFVLDCKLPELSYVYPIMRLFMHSTPALVRLPHRVGDVKVLNENAFVPLVYRLSRPFVPEKIHKRLSFLGKDCGNLHKDYPPEIMPEEYGGYLGPMNDKVYKKRLLDRYELERKKFSCS